MRAFFDVWGVFPLQLFLFTRVAYLMMSLIGMTLIPALFYHPDRRQMVLAPYPIIDGLCRWDCGWFVTIVKDGYTTAENAKVFPLLPLLGWSFEKVTGIHHIIGFLLVSNLASLASYFVIYRLFKERSDEPAARWALLLMACYPFAYFQATAQPESLMILLTAISLWLASKGKHLKAGFWLGVAVMARHVAIFYGPGLFVAHLKERGWRPKALFLNPSILGLGLPFLFVAAFAWHLKVMVGDPLAFWNARTIGWGDMVWYGWLDLLKNIPYSDRPEFYYYMVSGLIPWAGAIALLTRKSWVDLGAAATFSLTLMYSSGAATGLGRYTASVWPAFLPLGLYLSKRPNLQGPAIAGLALVQGVFFFLFSHQFRVF